MTPPRILGIEESRQLVAQLAAQLTGLTAYEALDVLGSVQKRVVAGARIHVPAANDPFHHFHGRTMEEATRELDNAHGALLASAAVELTPENRRRGLSVIPNAG